MRNWIIYLTVAIISFLLCIFYTHPILPSPFSTSPSASNRESENSVPRLAYLLSGSDGDMERLERILQAVYHPLNVYIVHLDAAASPVEHKKLLDYIDSHTVFSDIGNVKMIEEQNHVSKNGPTEIATVLHAAAILLKEGGKWDWFINLDASSYPLVTQDDLLFVLSQMPRYINFISLSGQLCWNLESQLMIVDNGLHAFNGGVVSLSDTRPVPTHFDIFTGSPWMGLTRSFIEYCILGWDNLPRLLLMYHVNSISSAKSYFQTVMFNSHEFCNSTLNIDLHFHLGNNRQSNLPHFISMDDLGSMCQSGAPFAREFHLSASHEVLDWIDLNVLHRGSGMLVPGGWCAAMRQNDEIKIKSCLRIGNVTYLQPGRGAKRLAKYFNNLLYNRSVKREPAAALKDQIKEMVQSVSKRKMEIVQGAVMGLLKDGLKYVTKRAIISTFMQRKKPQEEER